MNWLPVTVGDKNPRGVTVEHAENKGMIFHVLLTSPMCCRHLLLCSLWYNSEHWYRHHCSSQRELRFLFSVSSK